MKLSPNFNSYFSEFFGTFSLVFVGTGAIITNQISQGIVTHVGVALTFGLIVMAMIYSLGDVSGAHLNPAVTFGFWVSRQLKSQFLFPYILSQCLGAILASMVLKLIFFPEIFLDFGSQKSVSLGNTIPAYSSLQSFVLEIFLTLILMFVILHVSTGAKEKGIMAGTAIGSVVGLEALFAGPISGASMNPARSLGPALMSGNFNSLWLYILAPVIGSTLAVYCCKLIRVGDCCDGEC